MKWSYEAECAVYEVEPPTAECRRCGEVDFEDRFDESGHCAGCQAYWESLMLSDVVIGGVK